MKSLFVPIALLALSATVFLFSCARSGRTTEERAPRIVNLINFVRNTEPRPVNISDEELYRTTLAQTELLRRHGLKGTFLLQYDALINPKYQALMKQALAEGSEVGGWWEITQPHVEAAGMEWRGAYPWDWHANVGFSSGYEPQEREKLVDTYMAKFKEVFGRYPASVARGSSMPARCNTWPTGTASSPRATVGTRWEPTDTRFGEDTGTKDTIRAN